VWGSLRLAPTRNRALHDHALCTLWVHPPNSPCPTLSAQVLREDIMGSDVMRLKVSCCRYATLGFERFKYHCECYSTIVVYQKLLIVSRS